jgi:N-acetyl-gamma-glutamyl-phosphate reductase
MIRIGIIGASGYTGGELMRLLISHPEARLELVTSRSNVGMKVGEQFPNLNKAVDLCFEDVDTDQIAKRCDLVFTAVPHGASMKLVPELLAAGLKVVDLGADYRLDDPELYQKWYQQKHEDVANLKEHAVYGLPELFRDKIKGKRLVANPGCYPTSVILGVTPLLKRDLVDGRSIIADCKSGVSGAGRKEKPHLHFPEVYNDFKPYSFP